MVFYGFMGFTQLPPQHSQFFQKLSSRRPDLRNPVLLGCHWYLTCASCVCIFMYFPRMTVWRFFFLSFFPDDGFPWTTSCYFTCATVEPGFCSPETSPGMRLHWLYLKVSYGTGSKVDDEAWDDSFQQGQTGPAILRFGTFWMWVSSNIITFLACGHIVSSYPAFQACDGVKRVNLAADLVTKSEKSWTKGFKIAHVRISTVKASLVDL